MQRVWGLCHKLGCVTHYAQRNKLSGSSVGGGLTPRALTHHDEGCPEGGMSPVGVVVISRELEHGAAESFRAAHAGVGFQGLEHSACEFRRRLALHRPVGDQ